MHREGTEVHRELKKIIYFEKLFTLVVQIKVGLKILIIKRNGLIKSVPAGNNLNRDLGDYFG